MLLIMAFASSCQSGSSLTLQGCFEANGAPYIQITGNRVEIEHVGSFPLQVDYSKSGYALVVPSIELRPSSTSTNYIFSKGRFPYYYWNILVNSRGKHIYVIAQDHRKFAYRQTSESCSQEKVRSRTSGK